MQLEYSQKARFVAWQWYTNQRSVLGLNTFTSKSAAGVQMFLTKTVENVYWQLFGCPSIDFIL